MREKRSLHFVLVKSFRALYIKEKRESFFRLYQARRDKISRHTTNYTDWSSRMLLCNVPELRNTVN